MKYEVGDKIKMRNDLKAGNRYGGVMFSQSMLPYLGEILEVETITDGKRFYMKETYHIFSDEMFEGLADDPLVKKIEERNNKPPILEGKDFNHQVGDSVNHPEHYQSDNMEAIDVIEAFNLNFSEGSAIKYILRAGKKGDRVEDYEKAIWFLERLIENERD